MATYGGGYSQRSAAWLLARVYSLQTRAEAGDWKAVPELLDYRRAWNRPAVNRDLLWQYIHNEDAALAEVEMDELRRQIGVREEKGKSTASLWKIVEELLALWRLAGELNEKYGGRTYKPYLTGVGAQHRGYCTACGGRVEAGRVWLIHGRPERWHEECLEPAEVAA